MGLQLRLYARCWYLKNFSNFIYRKRWVRSRLCSTLSRYHKVSSMLGYQISKFNQRWNFLTLLTHAWFECHVMEKLLIDFVRLKNSRILNHLLETNKYLKNYCEIPVQTRYLKKIMNENISFMDLFYLPSPCPFPMWTLFEKCVCIQEKLCKDSNAHDFCCIYAISNFLAILTWVHNSKSFLCACH